MELHIFSINIVSFLNWAMVSFLSLFHSDAFYICAIVCQDIY